MFWIGAFIIAVAIFIFTQSRSCDKTFVWVLIAGLIFMIGGR